MRRPNKVMVEANGKGHAFYEVIFKLPGILMMINQQLLFYEFGKEKCWFTIIFAMFPENSIDK